MLHRANAPLCSTFGDAFTAGQMVDPTAAGLDWYEYT